MNNELENIIDHQFDKGTLTTEKYIELISTIYTENKIFSTKNFEINLDKWGPGHPLWITGTSGDGKSTLANKLYKQYSKTAIVHVDLFLARISKTKEKFTSILGRPSVSDDFITMDYINSHPEIPYEIIKSTDIVSDCQEFIDYFNWLIDSAKTKYKKYNIIIEGCEITMYMDPIYIKNEPLIIMGTSELNGSFRRIRRDMQKDKTLVDSIRREYERSHSMEYIKKLNEYKEQFKKQIMRLI